jgi:hypothetical protein
VRKKRAIDDFPRRQTPSHSAVRQDGITPPPAQKNVHSATRSVRSQFRNSLPTRQYDVVWAAEAAGFASTVIDNDLGREGSGSMQRPGLSGLTPWYTRATSAQCTTSRRPAGNVRASDPTNKAVLLIHWTVDAIPSCAFRRSRRPNKTETMLLSVIAE